MKKILLFLFALTLGVSMNAQGLSGEQKFKNRYPWKYEFRVGYGGYPLMDSEMFLNPYYGGCDCDIQMFPDLGNMYSPKIKSEYMTGILSAEFSIHYKRWFSLAFNLGVNGMWRTLSDPLNGDKNIVKGGATFNLIPMARFQYVNSKYVRLYSGVGLGLYVGFFDGEVFVSPAAQLTPIGISIGRKAFFFAETCVGTASMGGNMGVGFRF